MQNIHSLFVPNICMEIRYECDYADLERIHGYQMSDVRYAFSDPCGMEMIIMVIIQHLNNRFFYAEHWEAHLPRDLMLVFACLSATTNISVLVRDLEENKKMRQGKMMKRVRFLHFNWDKLGSGRKSSCSFPHCFLAPILGSFQHKDIGLEIEQISVIFISQLGENWLGPGLSSLYGFPSLLLFSYHVLCILLGTIWPVLCFNMHDKFYSCVHTHYPLHWAPPSPTVLCWQGNATLWMANRRIRWPPPYW